ncbi:deoxyhypusine synthase family protein [bacterium]|nr:deoxyhypusine synthase family protein [Mariniblastus sp.]MDB4386164.1 deoxyhypusine synthase family protein [bacterium]MDA7905900.1 deoxyhypusine synthase family protein [Mariniblastus sp.]MDA7924160.1 deoxyhypusine synthase family protein [Mariniblastus sp.]MDB4468491.1 deoxyhypusine synthase family protein [bacterium]
MSNSPISDFLDQNFLHFNARETVAAARSYKQHLEGGGKMLVSLAGAMSTAELGISLAEMIRTDKVHAISCTGANLEEDVFNLVAHNEYRVVPNYRDLSPTDETALLEEGFNRVTDTCIPETVMRHIEGNFMSVCAENADNGISLFPFEVFYKLFETGVLEPHFQIDPSHSWLLAAFEKKIPVYSPGFEDSTLGNIFAARCIEKKIQSHHALRSGTEQMEHLVNWYLETDAHAPIGFFQIAGGIAGDFAICAVPTIIQDLKKDIRLWQYFAQISDSTTSYGSYSGAVPNEKITWSKLAAETPRFMINSDASIVAPLIFAYVLGK